MMDDGSNQQSISNGGGGISMSIGGNKGQDDQPIRAQYSMPGILHFLQTEWARFEMEKSQWEVERAELQARIAFLQGERKGQENLKQDLVRRIKMLEFALKQERAKFHKLKFGAELNQGEIRPPVFEKKDDEPMDGESLNTANSNVTWRQGRQLLRQYLQEIGYTDTIIDVRSSRVRQLLGLQGNNADKEDLRPMVNGDGGGKRPSEGQGRRTPKKIPASMAERALIDSEASVIATFDFLASENVDEDEMLSDGDDMHTSEEAKTKVVIGNESMAGMEDEEEALAEFDFLMSESGSGEVGADKKDLSPSEDWGMDQQSLSKLKEEFKRDRKGKKGVQNSADDDDDVDDDDAIGIRKSGQSALQEMMNKFATDMDDMSSVPMRGNGGINYRSPETDMDEEKRLMVTGVDEPFEPNLGLGELEGLTVNNEADPLSYDLSPKEAFRKTWNAKYTLRSHFDGVRALAFHPVEPVLITASEDHTLKLWNLQKTVPVKKSASLDVEPIYTFRAHQGPVLSLAVSPTGETCYSGGADSTIRCWNIPNSNIDPYDSFDPSVVADTLVGHTDGVWSLAFHSSKMQLLSCSADGTVKLWCPGMKSPLLNTYTPEQDMGLPTSVDFVRCEPGQLVAAYTSSLTNIYDLETCKSIITLESNQAADPPELNNQINCIVSHPTLPITITAHEDRHIRFFDNNTGKMIHSMVAHLDAVTSLAVDPNGLYLLSGSHDCSIRLWNLDTKTCVQEITSHRKKFDESIHGVAFHPSKPYIASAGADALAKVFV